MKNVLLSFLATAGFTLAFATSESEIKIIEIKKTDFTAISVEEARVFAKRIEKSGDSTNASAYIKFAMDSQRLEIMNVCFEENLLSSKFSRAVWDMPDKILKYQLISHGLRNPRVSWVNEGDKFTYDEGTREFTAIGWWIPLLRKYLPSLPMDYAVLNTREKRLKLADEFDEAAGIPIVVEPEAERVWPPKPAGKAEASSTARTGPQAPPAYGVATAPIAEAASVRESGFLWLSAAAAAALAAAIAWLFARSQRNG